MARVGFEKPGMANTIAPQVLDYFAEQGEPGRERRLCLHQMILELSPGALVDIAYRMPTYRHGESWVALANQKHHIWLYTCSHHHIRVFAAAHPGVKTGKGCINLRDRDVLPMKDLADVVRHAIEHPKSE
jgi:uncharacterized protein YdhG (YjbR/CyaY superfamily)